MQTIIFDSIPFTLTDSTILKGCRAENDEEQTGIVLRLAAEARKLAKPKAMVRIVMVEKVDDETVTLDGVTIHSRLVRVNLDKVHRAFAYVATCGAEAEAWSLTLPDMLEQFYADEIKKTLVHTAMTYTREEVQKRFDPHGQLSVMSPGSLKEWPIENQHPLFCVMGDTQTAIGVTLTDSCLMLPSKSVSGLLFSDSTGHVNCIMCPMEVCPGRRAPYDPAHYEKHFGIKHKEHNF